MQCSLLSGDNHFFLLKKYAQSMSPCKAPQHTWNLKAPNLRLSSHLGLVEPADVYQMRVNCNGTPMIIRKSDSGRIKRR